MLKTSEWRDRIFQIALGAALFLILVGSRAALIRFAGSTAPYADEWDADWGALLRPYIAGTLAPDAFVAPLNEHRILFTRLLVLAIFNLSGYWDVVLQMIVNAILGSAVLVLTAFALSRVLSGRAAIATVACCLVNVAPFAYDNVLLGLNTHFYLLPAFSLAALCLAAGSPAWSPRWFAAAACGAASYFCLASGALTLAAIAATHGAQMACGRRTGWRESAGIAALAASAALMLAFVPHVPESDPYRARSFGEFLYAAASLAQWPGGRVAGWLLLLPSVLFCLRVLADRASLRDPRWFNLAALAWVAANIAALADGRARMIPQSRYFDTLVLGLEIHFVSALWLVQAWAPAERRARLALAAWVVVLAVGLTHAERHLPRQIETWRENVEAEGENVRFYLAAGDRSALAARPGAAGPDAGRLKAYLDAPEALGNLPPELTGRAPPRDAVEAGKQAFLTLAPAGLGLGALMLVALFGSRRTADASPAEAGKAEPSIAAAWWEAPPA